MKRQLSSFPQDVTQPEFPLHLLIGCKRAVQVVRQEARQAVRNELKDAITALLLSCEMALQVPNLQSGVETRMQTVYELAQEIRAKLEHPDAGSISGTPVAVHY